MKMENSFDVFGDLTMENDLRRAGIMRGVLRWA